MCYNACIVGGFFFFVVFFFFCIIKLSAVGIVSYFTQLAPEEFADKSEIDAFFSLKP